MEEKTNICMGENKEARSKCCTDIENIEPIMKYGLPDWITEAINDWNVDFIYIKNFDNHIEIGPAQINIIR